MNRSDIPILLLAAGQSSRMRGRDKLLEPIDGVPLLRRQAIRALSATEGPVLVLLPPAPHPRYDVLDGLGVTLVPVPDAAEGMNASLRRAIAALPKDAQAAMVLLADLPDLTVDDLKFVMQSVDLSVKFFHMAWCHRRWKTGPSDSLFRRSFRPDRKLERRCGGP